MRTFVFASPGLDVDAPGNLINTFNRSLDPVPAIGDVLNETAGPILTIAGNPTWALNPHSMEAYLTEVQQLLSLASDPSNTGFFTDALGIALESGSLWTGELLQIRIGSADSDNIVARDFDHYILTGEDADRILFTEGSVSAFVDAGAGTDLVFLADIFGNYTRADVANGV